MNFKGNFMFKDMKDIKEDLAKNGYAYVEDIASPSDLEALGQAVRDFSKRMHTQENLESNAIYVPSNTDTRESYASMVINEGQASELPHVVNTDPNISKLMDFHDDLLSYLIGKEVPRNNRKMLNCQIYKSQGLSTFLRRHRDGNYCSYKINDEKAFEVQEGLYSRYVFGINIENENVSNTCGTSLYDTQTGKVTNLPHRKGSLIIFDNIRMEHFVEPLDQPRLFIGIRSFDVEPIHFIRKDVDYKSSSVPSSLEGYDFLPSLDSPGHCRAISTEEATERLLKFYKEEWPKELEKITREKAVF